MSNFIFMLGVCVLCQSISGKIQSDALVVLCVVAVFADVWSYLFWRNIL